VVVLVSPGTAIGKIVHHIGVFLRARHAMTAGEKTQRDSQHDQLMTESVHVVRPCPMVDCSFLTIDLAGMFSPFVVEQSSGW
jgi:hypothetical protein